MFARYLHRRQLPFANIVYSLCKIHNAVYRKTFLIAVRSLQTKNVCYLLYDLQLESKLHKKYTRSNFFCLNEETSAVSAASYKTTRQHVYGLLVLRSYQDYCGRFIIVTGVLYKH